MCLVIINVVASDTSAASIIMVPTGPNREPPIIIYTDMSFPPMHVLGTPLYTIPGNNSFPHMNIVCQSLQIFAGSPTIGIAQPSLIYIVMAYVSYPHSS